MKNQATSFLRKACTWLVKAINSGTEHWLALKMQLGILAARVLSLRPEVVSVM